MSRIREKSFWGLAGLLILGLLAVVLSMTAIGSVKSNSDTSIPARTSFAFNAPVDEKELSSEVSPSDETSVTGEERTDDATEGSSSDEIENEALVAVVGDSNSIGDPVDTWLGPVRDQLGWQSLTNLSAPGRGYITAPRSCENSPCTPFSGTVEAVAEINPDIVIVFGGVADGDVPITEIAAQTFTDMRSALPEAEIIAISPVYSDETVPNWAPLHAASIQAGVEAAGGTYIDVGQPALGDGETMNADAHEEVARIVIEKLQSS